MTRFTPNAALAVFAQWTLDTATLDQMADLEARFASIGANLQQVGQWSSQPESSDPRAQYLDPLSILEDSSEILDAVLDERERVNGEKDEVLRDLIKRIKIVTGRR